MKLTRDEPGVLLTLEAEGFHLPRGATGCVALFVAPFVLVPLFIAVTSLLEQRTGGLLVTGISLVFSLFWWGAIALALTTLYRRAWLPRALRADGRAGTLEIVEHHVVTACDRARTLRLPQLTGATLQVESGSRARSPVPALAGMTFTPPNVRLVLRVDEGTGRVRAQTLKLGVEGIDSHQEIADLAYRLGAAAGLPYQRVVRNDPRDFEIELGRAGAPGFARVPTLDSRADYARNKVASAAAAATAQERVAPFDPATFGCDHKVTAWSPLREVRFEKPFGFAAVGCLPFAAAGFLAAPAVFVLMGGASTGLGERVGVSLFVGVFGLLIGGVSLYAAYSALPRRVVLDWSERTIRLGGLFRRQEVAFSDVTRLALKCVRVYHSGGKNSSSYHSYHCELHAHVRDPLAGGEKPLLLVETSHHREDPDTPYRQALPLVTELATALNVRREVIDYT